MIDEKKIEAEREHRKIEALRAQGEVIEHLRVLEVLHDPSKDGLDKLERTQTAANDLALVIREEI